MSKGSCFISFGDVSGGSYEESGGAQSRGKGRGGVTSSLSSPVYTGSDPSLAQLSKKLLKRDGTTRRKSLHDVQDIIHRSGHVPEGSSIVIEFIPHFCYVYERLWSDNDRSIREGAQLLLQSIIKAISTSDDKQALVPYMRVLIGPWRLSCLDACSEVAIAAKAAWDLAIPGVKRRQKVLYYLSPCYIRFVHRILTSPNMDAIPDAPGASSMTADEAQDRTERVTLSAICSIEELFNDLSEPDVLQLAFTGATVPAALATANLEEGSVVGLKEVLADTMLWSKMASPAFTPTILRLFTAMTNKIRSIFSVASSAAAPATGADASADKSEKGKEANAVSSDEIFVSDFTPELFLESCGCTISTLYPKLIATARTLLESPQKISGMCTLALDSIVAANNTFSNCWQHFSILSQGGKKKGFLDVLNLWLSVFPEVAFDYLLPLVASFPVASISVMSCTSDRDGEWDWKVGERIVEILDSKLASVQQRHGACAISTAETLTYMLLKRTAATCEPAQSSRRGLLCVNTLVKALEYAFIFTRGAAPHPSLRQSLERLLVQLHRASVAVNLSEMHSVSEKSWVEVLWPMIGSSLEDALIATAFYSDNKVVRENEVVLTHVVAVLSGVQASVSTATSAPSIPTASSKTMVLKKSEGIFLTSSALCSAALKHIADTDANKELTSPQWQQLQLRGLKLLCRLHQAGLAGNTSTASSLFHCVSRTPSDMTEAGKIVRQQNSCLLDAALIENDPALLRDAFLMLAALAQDLAVRQSCEVQKGVSSVVDLCVSRTSATAACIALQCGLCCEFENGMSLDITAAAEASMKILLAQRPLVLSVVCVFAAMKSILEGNRHHHIEALGEFALECASRNIESSNAIYMSALLTSVQAFRGTASQAVKAAISEIQPKKSCMFHFINDCQMLLVADQEKMLLQTLSEFDAGTCLKVPQLLESNTINYFLKLADAKAHVNSLMREVRAVSSSDDERYRSVMRKSSQHLSIPCVPTIFLSWDDLVSLGKSLTPSATARLIKNCTISCNTQIQKDGFSEASMELFAQRVNRILDIRGCERKDVHALQNMNDIISWLSGHGQTSTLPTRYDLFTREDGLSNLKNLRSFEMLLKLVNTDQRWMTAYIDVTNNSKAGSAFVFSFLYELHQGCAAFPQLKFFANLRVKTLAALRCPQVKFDALGDSSSSVYPPLELWKLCENLLSSDSLKLKDQINSYPWVRGTVSDILNCILQREQDTGDQPSARNSLRIDTPIVTDSMPAGTTVYYIEQQACEEGFFRMRSVEASVQKSHLSEIPAYYTLQIDGDREVQTEAHRILLEEPKYANIPQTQQFGLAMAALAKLGDCDQELIQHNILKWLLHACQRLMELSESGTKTSVAECRGAFLDAVCDALIQLGQSADQSMSLEAMNEKVEVVFGAYRQAAVKLLDTKLGDDFYVDLNTISNRIIQALAESNAGRGSGLWLPKTLQVLVLQIKARQGKDESTASTFWAKMKEKITKGRRFDFVVKESDGALGKVAALEAEKAFIRDCFERNSKYLEIIGYLFCTLMGSVAGGAGDCHEIYTAASRASSKPSSPRESKRELLSAGESSLSSEYLVKIYPWRALLQACKTHFLSVVLGSLAEDVLTSPGLTAVCVKCLRLYWATNSDKPSLQNRSIGAELMPERWEVQAYRLCLEVFTKRMRWFPKVMTEKQEELCKLSQCSAAMSLHYGLLHASIARNEMFLKELLGHAIKDDTAALLREVAMSFSFADSAANTSASNGAEDIREMANTICSGLSVVSYVKASDSGYELVDSSCPSYPIIAGKVLDAWYRSGGDPVAISLNHHKLDAESKFSKEEDEEEAAVRLALSGMGYEAFTEQERAEKQRQKDAADLEKDMKLFEAVVGSEFAAKLSALVNELTANNENQRPTSYESARSIVLLFLLILQRVDQAALQRQEDRGFIIRARCGAYLREVQILPKCAILLLGLAEGLLGSAGSAASAALPQNVENILQWCMPAQFNAADVLVPLPETSLNCEGKIDEAEDGIHMHEYLGKHLEYLALLGLFRMTVVLPAVTRTWYNNDLSRSQKVLFGRFVETTVRPASLERELQLIRDGQAAGRWNSDELEVRGHRSNGGEVAATFTRDDAKVEVKIRIPAQYPLKNVEVDCITRLGVPEAKWRRWSFQIIQLLSMQDGTIIDGVLLWKKNLENEFDGVEPCPICYSTLHHKSMSLPSMACPTCSNKFHPLCLNTWFKQSGKYKCVLCQQPFFQG